MVPGPLITIMPLTVPGEPLAVLQENNAASLQEVFVNTHFSSSLTKRMKRGKSTTKTEFLSVSLFLQCLSYW